MQSHPTNGTKSQKEASTMEIVATIGSTTVTHRGGHTHHIGCGRCGESVRYSGREFTIVEAERHERWCAKNKG